MPAETADCDSDGDYDVPEDVESVIGGWGPHGSGGRSSASTALAACPPPLLCPRHGLLGPSAPFKELVAVGLQSGAPVTLFTERFPGVSLSLPSSSGPGTPPSTMPSQVQPLPPGRLLGGREWWLPCSVPPAANSSPGPRDPRTVPVLTQRAEPHCRGSDTLPASCHSSLSGSPHPHCGVSHRRRAVPQPPCPRGTACSSPGPSHCFSRPFSSPSQ